MRIYPTIIFRFLTREFIKNILIVLGVVGGLTLVMASVENMNRPNMTLLRALSESAFQLLEWMPIFMPVIIFMATLLAMYRLTRTSEITIVRGAGLSPAQWLRPFAATAIVFGVLMATVVNPLASRWSALRNARGNDLAFVGNSLWVRELNDDGTGLILQARRATQRSSGLEFRGVSIFKTDKNFILSSRSDADTVLLKDGFWIINGAEKIPTRLDAAQIYARSMRPADISFWDLPHFIHSLEIMGFPTRAHWLQWFVLLFMPLSFVAMAVLGGAFSLTRAERARGWGGRAALGVLTCFAVYFATHIFQALGLSGALPPILAVVAPPMIILVGASFAILKFDDL